MRVGVTGSAWGVGAIVGALGGVVLVGCGPSTVAPASRCPTGSDWDGRDCAQKRVVTKIECPAGTTLEGSSCVANVSKDCPAGTSFQTGKGCVANLVSGGPALPAGVEQGSCPAGMSAIPKGSFKLTDQGDVSVGAFCLDLTEVTVEAYAACVKKGACSAENASSQFWDGKDEGKGACNWGVSGREKHPMNCVDWGMAATFCRAQGGRLPTEEEWEWAARGGDAARTYPWGNAEPDFQACWSGVSKRSGTCPVGSAPEGRGRFGQLDLAGNVWEWTASLLGNDQTARIIRGGSWDNDDPARLSAANRSRDEPSNRGGDLGFRCAR
jgi:formylglycine-generating enzyme